MDVENIQIFLSSLCRLNCSYCFISKNPANAEIDKLIEKDVKNDLYFNYSKTIIDKESLKEVEFWGGEPLLGIDRVGDNFKQYLDYFTNINRVRIVSNFTENIDGLLSFIDRLESYGKKIRLDIQVSLDGPKNVMKLSRGEKAFEAILASLAHFVCNIKRTEHVSIYINFKPTLDIPALREAGKDLKAFHEFYIDLSSSLRKVNNNPENLFIDRGACITLAVPGEYTAEDGKFLCEIYKEVLELDTYFKTEHDFSIDFLNRKDNNILKVMHGGGHISHCGAGLKKLVIKGNNEYSVCQRGMLDSNPEYRKMSKDYYDDNGLGQKFLSDLDMLKLSSTMLSFTSDNAAGDETFNRRMLANYMEGNKFQIGSNAALLYQLSLSGLADEIYSKDNYKLLRAAFIIRSMTPCIYDNVLVTGSPSIRPLSTLKFYCNGVMELLADKLEEDFLNDNKTN